MYFEIYVYVHLYPTQYICKCACVWMLEVKLKCIFQVPPILYLRKRSLFALSSLNRLPGQTWVLTHVFTYQIVGLYMHITLLGLFNC